MDASEDLPNLGDMIDVDAVTEAAEQVAESFLNQEPQDENPQSEEEAKVDAASAEPTELPVVKRKGTESDPTTSSIEKRPKKRIRRAGKYPAAAPPEPAPTSETVEDAPGEEGDAPNDEVEASEDIPLEEQNHVPGPVVSTKHDEKWNKSFDKLLEYKAKHGTTMVPQCYQDDARLGRWVHYQRVEYWLFQQTGNAKITKERINRLNAIGFEWDPQKATWNSMFEKLKTVSRGTARYNESGKKSSLTFSFCLQFKEAVGHTRVPKGYSKDRELANWVRNQRLEEALLRKGKKSRMTPERYNLLNELEFKWSSPTPKRSKNKDEKGSNDKAPAEEADTVKEEETIAVAEVVETGGLDEGEVESGLAVQL
jgi:Helicase associated domain